MTYRLEIATLRAILSQFAACEAEPCGCCSICREGVSRSGYTFFEAHNELASLLRREQQA